MHLPTSDPFFNSDNTLPFWIVLAVAVLLLIAGVITAVLVVKKKKQNITK